MYAPKTTMGVVDPLKGPSYALVACSEKFRLNHNSVNIYLPKIMLYLPLANAST